MNKGRFFQKQGVLGPQKLRSLKSPPPLITREFAIKLSEMAVSKNVKNVQIDPQTTEIW